MPVRNLQGPFALARPTSFVFSYHPFDSSQEQNLLTSSCGWGIHSVVMMSHVVVMSHVTGIERIFTQKPR